MWPAFPTSDYYGGSAPSRPDRSTVDPARCSALVARPVARAGTVPVFTDRRLTKEEPGYTPAASPRLRRRPSPWPPGPTKEASPEVAHPEVRQARTAPSPDPPGSSWWDTLGGFTHRFLAYSFSSCSPGPPPSDGAGHAPALSGPLATHHRHLPDRAALSFTSLLRQASGGGLSPPLEQSAPHGARGGIPRSGSR